MWNMDMPQMTVWRMRTAYWTTKATHTNTYTHTHTHTHYVIIIAFPLQQRLEERALVLRYTYIACLINFMSGLKVSKDILIYVYESQFPGYWQLIKYREN
jgi:hypothetical protein